MLCTVLIQILMSLLSPRLLNKILPKIVTGSVLLLVGVYLIGNGRISAWYRGPVASLRVFVYRVYRARLET